MTNLFAHRGNYRWLSCVHVAEESGEVGASSPTQPDWESPEKEQVMMYDYFDGLFCNDYLWPELSGECRSSSSWVIVTMTRLYKNGYLSWSPREEMCNSVG